MGMFDYVKCECALPGNPPKELSGFQTKSMYCCMDHYKIGEDKQLYIANNKKFIEEEQLDKEKHDFDWVEVNTSEEINFYTSHQGDWYEYQAIFNKGQLVELKIRD